MTCDDAGLDDGEREGRADGVWKAFEPVAADEEDVLHAAVLEVRHHRQPELRALGLLEPETKNLALARDGHAEGDVDGLLHDDAAVAYRDEEHVQMRRWGRQPRAGGSARPWPAPGRTR